MQPNAEISSPSSRLMLLLATLVAAIALAGCGDTVIDQGKAEDLVMQYVNDLEGDVKPESASCPEDVKAEADKTFDCTVTFADEAEGTVTVHIEDDEGNVNIGEGDFKPPPE